MTRSAGPALAIQKPAPAIVPATPRRDNAPLRSAKDQARGPATLLPDISRVPVHPHYAPAAARPTPIQRCGIGSSCDCPPHEKLAGVQRDLRRATAGGGAPLPAATRDHMGRAFSSDFAAVRVHTGPAADSVVSALQARALTAGTDILFRSGAYRPDTHGGDRLLAHELAHVSQQAAGLPATTLDRGPADPLERAADTAAGQAQQAPAAAYRGPASQGNSTVPRIVGEVLGSSGTPLDTGTRSVMESAFGHDFSRVRIHTDQRAASSARAVGALAYTAGPNVVFAAGQYAPSESQGRHLLAHELAHVVQQPAGHTVPTTLSSPGDALEQAADRAARAAVSGQSVGSLDRADSSAAGRLHRMIGRLDCTAAVASAPADPRAELADIDSQARNMAQQLGTDLAADAATVRGGIPASPSPTLQAFIDHFGLPPAEGTGFLNRLTGEVRPSQEVAAGEEVQILSRRFALVARIFGDSIHYSCGDGPVDLGGGCTPDCSSADAWSCRGTSGVALCPPFWTGYADNTARAAILIHEAFHIIWGLSEPRGVGEIGDETLRGPGRNFDAAGCYEFIVDDVFGTDSSAGCPPIP